jgi:hypothetical protein
MKPALFYLARVIAWAAVFATGVAFPLWFRGAVVDCGLADRAGELVLEALAWTGVALLLALAWTGVALWLWLWLEWYVDWGPIGRRLASISRLSPRTLDTFGIPTECITRRIAELDAARKEALDE